eukprot:TRINITY_DN814_c0_g1_i1.p1 TRINITY_DN814_c0_g1~~TRINITY_DN814_c0_g1_i1.p1  ORF type:complete len:140 (+),score=27.67 TRINITY_DN814_c0_g1_i1:31-450(+)
MFTLYLVLAILIVEAIALAIFLLPVPRMVLQAMINIHSKLKVPLRFLFATLGYFVFDSFVDMRKYETKPVPSGHSEGAKLLHLSSKFRAERNFYLNCFAFTLFVILLRVETIMIKVHRLEDKQVHSIEVTTGTKVIKAE